MVLDRAMDLAVYLVAVPWLELTRDFSISPWIPAGRSLPDVEFEQLMSKLSIFSFLLVTGTFVL